MDKDIRNHKCLCLVRRSHIIILDNLDIYEMINIEEYDDVPPKYKLVKVPAKANINFKEWYGDGKDTAKANFTNPIFPVEEQEDGTLRWDY